MLVPYCYFFLIINCLILRALHPFASRTRICMHVRRKSWQRYNYFAYVVDILLISFYLHEGQGVTKKKCVSLQPVCFTRFRLFVTLGVRFCLRVSRGSVWPRNLKAFSEKLETRYSLRVSILQAAKRNGGGVFVAFVMVGSGGRGRLHRHCQVTRSNARATSIPFGRKSHASTRKGTQATVRASSDSQEQAGQTEPGTRKGK